MIGGNLYVRGIGEARTAPDEPPPTGDAANDHDGHEAAPVADVEDGVISPCQCEERQPTARTDSGEKAGEVIAALVVL
ncbi:hypothetical protein [Nocardiopsis gilva]|uniref:hypothetical protein n=1 Tax=Nocardiopsis gilva TaxID=280236 RepID=UPI0003464FF9|nr:hypothetical protein [Nocardiopsis gilva]